MQIRLQVHNKHGYPRSGITGKRPAERLSERAIRLWTGNYADKTGSGNGERLRWAKKGLVQAVFGPTASFSPHSGP